jgi:MFS family permease
MSDQPFPPIPPLSGIYPPGTLVPMTFGQILDRVGRIVRSRWKTLAGIGVAPFGLMVVAEGLFFGALYLPGFFKKPPTVPDFHQFAWIAIPFYLVLMPAIFVMYGLYYGASSYATLQADRDLPVTIAQAYAHAWSRLGRYAWLMILRALIIALPFIPLVLVFGVVAGFMAGMVSHGSDNAGILFLLIPLGVLLYIGAMIYAVIMSLRFSLAYCACVHEGLTARQALTRSGVLTQGAKGRIFLVLLVIYAISYAVMMVIYVIGIMLTVVIAGVAGLSAHSLTPLGIAAIAVAGLCAAVVVIYWAALLMAAYSAAFAVLYRDQCLRRDGPQAFPVSTTVGT